MAEAGSSTKLLDLAGVPTLFRASDGPRADAIDGAVGLLPPHPGPALLEVAFDAVGPHLPHERWEHADGDVRAWWTTNDLFLGHGTFRGRVGDRAAVVGGEGNLERGFRQLLPYVATHLLSGQGRFLLHAGAIQRDGQATLVLGGSGSGKSTLAVSAFAAGWGVLGDDLVVLRLRGDGSGIVEVTGIAKPVLAPGDVVQDLGLTARPVADDPRGRWEVDVAVGTPHGAWSPVTSTLLASHGREARSDLDPLATPQLVEWLLFSYLARREPARLRRFLPVAAAVASRRGWVVHHSSDRTRRPGDMGALLRRLATAASDGCG